MYFKFFIISFASRVHRNNFYWKADGLHLYTNTEKYLEMDKNYAQIEKLTLKSPLLKEACYLMVDSLQGRPRINFHKVAQFDGNRSQTDH